MKKIILLILLLISMTGCIGDLRGILGGVDNDRSIGTRPEISNTSGGDIISNPEINYDEELGIEFPASSKWVTVGPHEEADYSGIQEAIKNVYPKQRILVVSGDYTGNIVVNKDITITGLGEVTINGGKYGFKIHKNAAPTIENFIIRNTSTAVHAKGTIRDWSLRNIVIKNNDYGINAVSSSSNWSITDFEIVNNKYYGLEVRKTSGDWSIENGVLTGNKGGIRAQSSTGSWSANNISMYDNDRHSLLGDEAKPRVTNSWFRNYEGQVDRRFKCRNKSCNGKYTEGMISHYPLDKLEGSESPWVKNVTTENVNSAIRSSGEGSIIVLEENIEETIDVSRSDIVIVGGTANVRVRDDQNCINIEKGIEDVQIRSMVLKDCNIGIDTSNKGSEFAVFNVKIEAENHAFYASDSTGSWKIRFSSLLGGKTSLYVAGSTGSWEIYDTIFTDKILATRTDFTNGKIRYSIIRGSVESADGSYLDMQRNWWGDQGGPSPNKITGLVDTSYPCNKIDCSEVR